MRWIDEAINASNNEGWASLNELRQAVFDWMMRWNVIDTSFSWKTPSIWPIWLTRKTVIAFVFSGGYCPWCRMRRAAHAAMAFHQNGSRHHRVPLGHPRMFPEITEKAS